MGTKIKNIIKHINDLIKNYLVKPKRSKKSLIVYNEIYKEDPVAANKYLMW